MTRRQAAVLASRIFCVWFIYQAVLDVWAVPSVVIALARGSIFPGVSPSTGARFEQTLMVSGLTGLFRLMANAAAAIFFYRCGPGLIRFLAGGEPDRESNEAEPAIPQSSDPVLGAAADPQKQS